MLAVMFLEPINVSQLIPSEDLVITVMLLVLFTFKSYDESYGFSNVDLIMTVMLSI